MKRIRSDKKRAEILSILMDHRAPHFKRVYLVGFLKYAVKLSEEEICLLIRKYAKWNDYSPKHTAYQVHSIFKHGTAEGALNAAHRCAANNNARCCSFSSRDKSIWVGKENACGFVLEWYRVPLL